ncbi:MAG TPA: metallophosphoesterase [Kofleriaceae bacterium]
MSSHSRSAAAETFDSCPADKPSRDAGRLCYEPCKPGFEGVGPVCHRVTALRDGTCNSDEDKDGALCYPKCKPGYTGVGPVCWQNCPGGFRDDGAFCGKPDSYGRGAGYPWKLGDPIDSLKPAKKRCEHDHDQGCEKDGAIYYPKCKHGFKSAGCCVCSPKCEDGMTDIGVSCAKQSYGRGAGRDPESYGRGVGVSLTSCTSGLVWKPIGQDRTAPPFFLVIASDPQLDWYSKDDCSGPACELPFGDCKDEACGLKNAFKTNDQQLAAINAIMTLAWPYGAVTPPKGVIFNGDLTAYGHPQQWDWFMWYYVNRLRWPAYYGLGNHDYENNVGSCYGATTDKDWCARNSIEWMRSTVVCGRSKPFPANTITGYDDASMAYSWDIGPYHFVQLQNHPLYPKDEKTGKTKPVPGIESSFTWLTSDLKRATAAGQHIIINMHDFGDHMHTDNAQFAAAIAGSNVRAIFRGHIHHLVGGSAHIVVDGRNVPVFYSGSSVYRKFLLVEFLASGLRVAEIDAAQGTPKLLWPNAVHGVAF